MRLLADVQLDVVILGLQPLNIDCIDKVEAVACLKAEAGSVLRGCLLRCSEPQVGLQKIYKTFGDLRELAFAMPGLDTIESLDETRRIDRFEYIVERVGIEGLNGKFVKRRNEYYQRNLFGCECTQNAETVDLGHLHIEKD